MIRDKGHGLLHHGPIILMIACLLVCPVLATVFPDNTTLPGHVPAAQFEVTVTGTTHNATVIRVSGNTVCSLVIRYANATWFSGPGTYDHEAPGILSGPTRVFRITGLEPGTRYHYQVTGCGAEGDDRSFATFPVTGTCRFVVYGDSREQAPLYTQADRHAIVADRIADEEEIQFVVNSGDLVADSGDREEWLRFFNATEKLRSQTTYVAVPGNHDDDRELFEGVFGWDGPYSFDCGNTRIYLLDSDNISTASLNGQAAMVSSGFRSPSSAKIVILHHPLFSSDEKHYGGWENLQELLVPAFQESGVRLVFSGHVHAFEQIVREGITYITEARGGAPAYPLNESRVPGSVRVYENTLGYSRVTIGPEAGRIVVEVIRVADISPDLRRVERMYPAGTTDARIEIPVVREVPGHPDLHGLICRLSRSNGVDCRDRFASFFLFINPVDVRNY